MREKHEKGILDVKYISTEDPQVDFLTKALPRDRFTLLINKIGKCNREYIEALE